MPFLKSRKPAGHAAGIFSDMTLDGPHIGTLVVVVDRAKNLPNRKAMGKQDPYCAMRLAKEAKKTDTDRRGGQTPKWDQELRFDVHDSPDYYKLKCSIFNDDKKTDLIGEAWIDLSEVIRLGGGQKDLWHQLNFKGKYAGELRIELTFYDTREQPQETRKVKQPKVQQIEVNVPETMADLPPDLTPAANRSLGPREIKRRPLPESPVGNMAVKPPALKEKRDSAAAAPPSIPSKIPLEAPRPENGPTMHAPVAKRARRASQQKDPLPSSIAAHPVEDYSPQDQYDMEPPSFGTESTQSWHSQSLALQTQHYQQMPQHHNHNYDHNQQLNPYQQQQEPGHDLYYHQRQHPFESEYRQPYVVDEPQRSDYEGFDQTSPQYPRRPSTQHMHTEPERLQHALVAGRPPANTAYSDSQLVRYQPHLPNEEIHDEYFYGDSAMHLSQSPNELLSQTDEPPPLPPKHREAPPRRSRGEFPPSAYVPQPLRVGVKRPSFSERSPLQSFEDVHQVQQEFDSSPQALHLPEQRRSMNSVDQYAPRPMENQARNLERRSMQEMPSRLHQHPPSVGSRRNSYEIRNVTHGPSGVYTESTEMEAENSIVYDQHTSELAHQPFVEDAPPSPSLTPTVARKAIGASPKKLSGVPFGPDAYDVLNPSSSPITNDQTVFQTPEQAKEAQRLREVEKLRDIGPIIGNDGREIDPSDHLPSDTWAPEPERKQRKPEHVIHIRTKGDKPSGARSSPVVIRHHRPGQGSQPQQNNPSPVTKSQPASSPATRTPPQSFIGGRNRLQKAMPANSRGGAVYSSPAVGAASTPSLVTSPHERRVSEHTRSAPAQQRRPSYDNRIPSHITRPPLAEYQVPVGSNYTPRSAMYDAPNNNRQQKAICYESYNETPSKPSGNRYSAQVLPGLDSNRGQTLDSRDRRRSYDQRSDYSFENHPEDVPMPAQQRTLQYFDDPLAAEMSLIDIGPSRNSYYQASMNRSLVRRW